MMATSSLDSLHDCLVNMACKKNLTKKAEDNAPEVLGLTPLPFKRRVGC